jgi:hypothetical protein
MIFYNCNFRIDVYGNILHKPEQPPMYQDLHMLQPIVAQPQPTFEDPLPSPVVKKESRLKHFFSPIRKKVPPPPPPPLLSSQPDLFISNVLANNMIIQPHHFQHPEKSMETTVANNITHPDHSSTTTTATSSSFQVSADYFPSN